MACASIFSFLAGPQAIWGPYGPPFLPDRRAAGLQKVFQVLSVCLSVHPSIFPSIPPSLFGLVVSYIANIPQTSDLAELGRQQTVDSRQQIVNCRQQTVDNYYFCDTHTDKRTWRLYDQPGTEGQVGEKRNLPIVAETCFFSKHLNCHQQDLNCHQQDLNCHSQINKLS